MTSIIDQIKIEGYQEGSIHMMEKVFQTHEIEAIAAEMNIDLSSSNHGLASYYKHIKTVAQSATEGAAWVEGGKLHFEW
ncbi:hypothetical protein [Oceanobacillus sp. FSL H7-0719]|uniref:hypothetical protein n=1 Tax=Oceanobacillus sp. FSL H7-0719 TaxID=2954507 RepID=UPI00324A77FE